MLFIWKQIKCVIPNHLWHLNGNTKHQCNVEKLTTLLKEAPLLSGFFAVTSCLPSPSLNWLTNEIPSLTYLTNELWLHGQAVLYLSDGEGLCGSCSSGCFVDCVWVYGAGKPSAHQRSSATNLCLHVCVRFEMIKPFHVTTAVHNLTSDVCVCKWKSDDSSPLPDKEMCVMWMVGETPCYNGYSLIRQHSHTVVV